VTSPTAPHKIFISIVIGRGFCSTARIYEPYVRVSKMHPCIRTVVTHYPYIRVVQPKSIANNVFFVRAVYIRAVYTGDRYALPVHTARTYVCTGRMHGCQKYTGIRVLGTHYLHRIAVLYGPYIRAAYTSDRYALPVNTGRTYGYTGVKNAPVCTGRTYGPYMRAVFTVVRIGL